MLWLTVLLSRFVLGTPTHEMIWFNAGNNLTEWIVDGNVGTKGATACPGELECIKLKNDNNNYESITIGTVYTSNVNGKGYDKIYLRFYARGNSDQCKAKYQMGGTDGNWNTKWNGNSEYDRTINKELDSDADNSDELLYLQFGNDLSEECLIANVYLYGVAIIPNNSATNTPTMISTAPTKRPTFRPTERPTFGPNIPTSAPMEIPTLGNVIDLNDYTPTIAPTKASVTPSQTPTELSTKIPTVNPTQVPTESPSLIPSNNPTKIPSKENVTLFTNPSPIEENNSKRETTVLFGVDRSIMALVLIGAGAVLLLCILIAIIVIGKRKRNNLKEGATNSIEIGGSPVFSHSTVASRSHILDGDGNVTQGNIMVDPSEILGECNDNETIITGASEGIVATGLNNENIVHLAQVYITTLVHLDILITCTNIIYACNIIKGKQWM